MRGLNAILLFFILVCCVRGEFFLTLLSYLTFIFSLIVLLNVLSFSFFVDVGFLQLFVDIIKTDLNIINVVKSFQFTRIQISLNLLN